MRVVHLVLSNAFAGIEQHVDELLSNKLNDKPILICNDSIADCFDKSISIYKIKNISGLQINFVNYCNIFWFFCVYKQKTKNQK